MKSKTPFIKLGRTIINIQDISRMEVVFRPVDDQDLYECAAMLKNLDQWCEKVKSPNQTMDGQEMKMRIHLRGNGHDVVSLRFENPVVLKNARDTIEKLMGKHFGLYDIGKGGE